MMGSSCLGACVVELLAHLPSIGRGLRPASCLVAPVVLRRVRRTASAVLVREGRADLKKKLSFDQWANNPTSARSGAV